MNKVLTSSKPAMVAPATATTAFRARWGGVPAQPTPLLNQRLAIPDISGVIVVTG
jgi:hypothetical protein